MTLSPCENVLDSIDDVINSHGLTGDVRVSVPHQPGRREIRIFGLKPPKGSVLDDIAGIDAVERVSVGKAGSGGIRLADEYVEELGGLLEASDISPLRTSDLEPSRQVVVDYCDPNASKALHVGHLRNLALGNALAAIFRSAGAETLTQSQTGDVGRSVGEAMAGYLEFGKKESPKKRGEKSDHFVGACYSQYVTAGSSTTRHREGVVDPVLAREAVETRDLATDQIDRWIEKDPESVALWKRVRDWVVAGHEETLERLGVGFDRVLPESDFLEEIESIAEWLLDREIAVKDDGAVVFYTGDSSYPVLVLQRSDGQSTQHLRYVALWHATRNLLDPADSIQVFGDEWVPLRKYGEVLLKYLAPKARVHPTMCLLHGMVTVDEQIVKSSGSGPWLVDDLLDGIIHRPEIMRMCGGDTERAIRIAAVIASGAFLASPPSRPMAVSEDIFFNLELNPGWAIACAAAAAWGPENDGSPDPFAEDPDYRFLVVQSQVHRQLLRRACAELDPSYVARFLGHLSRWFLNSRGTPRIARAMRSILEVGLTALGLGRSVRRLDPDTQGSVFRV